MKERIELNNDSLRTLTYEELDYLDEYIKQLMNKK